MVRRELHELGHALDFGFFTAGFHPFARRQDIHWMPKGRYAVMGRYLPTRGGHALDMMLRTCTLQANFDFSNEAECGERVRTALVIAPVVTAMFANSCYEEGQRSQVSCLRSRVWLDVDADRCGTPTFLMDEPFSYARYVDWLLDVPMFFIKRDGQYIEHHATFRDYVRDGVRAPDGTLHRARWDDWELHTSTVFPEVRLKPFIEFRSTDAVGSAHVCALPALLKGLLYDSAAGQAAVDRVEALRGDTPWAAFWLRCTGVAMRDPEIAATATALLELATQALDAAAVLDVHGRSEARFLTPMLELATSQQSPGDGAAAQLGNAPGSDQAGRAAFLRAFHFAGVGGPPTG